MVAWRSLVPPYRPLQRGSDTHLVNAIRRYHPVAVRQAPWLYCRVVTGGNTWNEDHFEGLFDRSCLQFREDEYEKSLARLAKRMPIYAYGAELAKRAPRSVETIPFEPESRPA